MSYIKLDRKLKDWQWKTEPLMVALWVHLLLEANYQEKNWKGMYLPSGTFPTSIKQISEKTGLTIQQTRNNLNKLQTTGEISIKSTNKYSLITINKWEEYQCADKIPTNKPTNKTSENQQTKLTKPNNTIRNKEDKNKKEYIYYGEFQNVPLTNEQYEKLQKQFPNDYKERIERVSSYCASTGKKYKDYLATIQNWARKDKPVVEDRLPTYDSSKNNHMSEEEREEILRLMKMPH